MSLLADLGQDLRYGLRTLRRSPGLTVMVALSLALGIAANTAIFSVLNALLWRPLPVTEPERLVFLSDSLGSGRVNNMVVRNGRLRAYSHPLYQRLRNDDSFEAVAAEDSWTDQARVARAVSTDDPSTARGQAVTANYFAVLGVPAFRGRTFAGEDATAPGANPVVILSHGFWQRGFGGDPAVVGGRLTVNGKLYTAVGVTPPGFSGSKVAEAVDFWVPLTMHADLHQESTLLEDAGTWWLHPIGRLRPGVSAATAQASLNVRLGHYLTEIQAQLNEPDRERAAQRQVRIELQPGARGVSTLRRDFREGLLVLQTGVALLLLIVCLNVSHLLLARAVTRQREMNIRTALGASRGRLTRQMLAEGLLLVVAGVAGAALLTRWLVDGLLSLSVSPQMGRALTVQIDVRVWAFTAALALGAAIVLGLVPAGQAWRADVQGALRATSQTVTETASRRRISRLLMTSQVALSLVLMMGAGLLSTSLRKLHAVDKGFDQEHLLLADLDFRFVALNDQQRGRLYDDLLGRMTGLPGVASASLAEHEILDRGRWTSTITFSGASAPIEPSPHIFSVTPDYFQTVGMNLARGRGFGRADREGAPRVAIVNETLARQVSGGDALGKSFRFGYPSSPGGDLIEVVGIVRDAKINSLREPPRPTVYCPLSQSLDEGARALQVRAVGDPAALTDQVRRAVQEAHPALRLSGIQTMASAVERSLRQERLLATLSSAFGLAALFLVCLGLYGVIAQWAAQRSQEIGVRMALGATRSKVQWLILRQAFLLVLAGVAVGAPAALAAARVLEGFLYGVAPFHPLTLTLAGLSLFLVAAAAAYLPARRASRADPMMALRSE